MSFRIDIKSLYLTSEISWPWLGETKRVGDLRVYGRPHPRSLNDDVYSMTLRTRSFSRFLRATLKAGREGLGTRLMLDKDECLLHDNSGLT